MGKAAGVSRRRRKNANIRFHHKTKFAKQKKKLILRQKIKDPLVRDAWDMTKSKAKNLAEMGLEHDPNKVIPIPKPIDVIFGTKVQKTQAKPVTEPTKKEVLEKIEGRANKKKDLRYHFGPELCLFLTSMMTKHKDDYKAMERDPNNHYLLSAGMIKRKIKQFLANPITGKAYEQAMEATDT